MKLNAICVMKNEVDIIGDTLKHALKYCDNVYLLDNGSDDGSWELVNNLSCLEPNLHIVGQTLEVFKNQLRNRIYNIYHSRFADDDWWMILDSDEFIDQDPKPLLRQIAKKRYDSMDVWQAQFYFTDKDEENYENEDKNQPIPERRFHYKINWREIRFFKNSHTEKWPETVSGRIPKRCSNKYADAPVCRHYAERTPEQIAARRKLRINNPFSFFHLKNKDQNTWLKKATECRVYKPRQKLTISLYERADYYLRQAGYWIGWRARNVMDIIRKLDFKHS